MVASLIAAASFVFALTAIDYISRQAEIFNQYSSIVESGSEFNDLLLLQARRGASNPAFAATISGSNNTNCNAFSQLYNSSAAVSLCRSLSQRFGAASTTPLSLDYGGSALLGQSARVVTLSNPVLSAPQTRLSRFVIPWGS